MKWLFVYHNDPDGWLSARVLYEDLPNIAKQLNLVYDPVDKNNICFIPADYVNEDKVYERIIRELSSNDKIVVIIVDFSFADWKRLHIIERMCHRLLFIDHHKSALERHEKDPLITSKGIVIINTDKAACQLAYEFAQGFTFNGTYPEWLLNIAKWDIWEWKDLDIPYVAYGLKFFEQQLRDPTNPLWSEYIANPNKFKDIGKVIVNSEIRTIRSLIKKGAFKVVRYDDYQVLCVNTNIRTSIPFQFAKEGIIDKYHIWAPYEIISDEKVNISFYTNPLYKAYICKDIAMKYQGGGHPGAAGCQIPLDDFIKILKSAKL